MAKSKFGPAALATLIGRTIAKRIRFLITFGIGVYAGVYLDQNFNIPKVNDPSQLWKNFQDYLDEHKKR